MLGVEVNLKYGTWIRDIVFEYIYTKYQSGPVYHDHTPSFADHIGGIDNYYNHYIYTGWQHWGQVIGNPLYRSPIYNDDGTISVKNSRFMAFHMGIDGRPAENITYRLLGTWQENAARFRAGQTVTGVVRTVTDYGTFHRADAETCAGWRRRTGGCGRGRRSACSSGPSCPRRSGSS